MTSSVPSAQQFLNTVVSAANAGSNAAKPFRLATVASTYASYVNYPNPPPLPTLIFDGESTTSIKQYAVVEGYIPAAGDRVVLAPIGNTWMIVGRVGNDFMAGLYRNPVTNEIKTEFGGGWSMSSQTGLVVPQVISNGKTLVNNHAFVDPSSQSAQTMTSGSGLTQLTNLTLSFTKQYSSVYTAVFVEYYFDAYMATSSSGITSGVSASGTNSACLAFTFNTLTQHTQLSGERRMTGLNAGTFTVSVYAQLTSGTGTLTLDTNGFHALHVYEYGT